MTRTERALENSKKISDRKKNAVLSIVTGLFADEYKKSDGGFNIYKLSKELRMSDNTIRKYLRLFELEGVI